MRRLLGTAAASALLATAALAHDFWLAPANLRPKPGEEVSMRLLVGDHLEGESKKRDAPRIEKFVLIGPDGAETAVAGKDGDDPAGRVRPDREGTYVVAFRGKRRATRLAAEKFEAYLREEGLEKVIEERERRGEKDAEGVEVYSRCAKAILCVGAAADAGHDRSAAMTLELFPATHPDRMAPGDEAAFRLVHDGKPLEGALVVARSAAVPKDAVSGRTDREGRVKLRLAHAGLWMVKATHMVRTDREKTLADWESLWASLVFDVPAPTPAKDVEKAPAGPDPPK